MTRTYETCGKTFTSRAAANKYARNIANASGIKVPVYETTGALVFGKPDPDGQNIDRANWAQVAVDAFQEETGTDDGDRLKDLLADLMHWCDREKQDFDVALDAARHHYGAETSKES